MRVGVGRPRLVADRVEVGRVVLERARKSRVQVVPERFGDARQAVAVARPAGEPARVTGEDREHLVAHRQRLADDPRRGTDLLIGARSGLQIVARPVPIAGLGREEQIGPEPPPFVGLRQRGSHPGKHLGAISMNGGGRGRGPPRFRLGRHRRGRPLGEPAGPDRQADRLVIRGGRGRRRVALEHDEVVDLGGAGDGRVLDRLDQPRGAGQFVGGVARDAVERQVVADAGQDHVEEPAASQIPAQACTYSAARARLALEARLQLRWRGRPGPASRPQCALNRW